MTRQPAHEDNAARAVRLPLDTADPTAVGSQKQEDSMANAQTQSSRKSRLPIATISMSSIAKTQQGLLPATLIPMSCSMVNKV